jgi:hypothetical protein
MSVRKGAAAFTAALGFVFAFAFVSLVATAGTARGEETAPPAQAQTGTEAQTPSAAAAAHMVACSSKPGARTDCAADTSKGVALVRSTGESPCLLGKTWGYTDRGVWVSDGCAGEFFVGSEVKVPEAAKPTAAEEEQKKKFMEHIPNAGFRLYEGEKGQIYLRIFSYVRYLNQKGLDPTYTDSFGVTKSIQIREDVQLNKVFFPFSGWFLTPKLRYYLYVWSQNPAMGDAAQVVAAGNLSYVFNRFITLGGGITSLPGVRSTEGQFPYWLGVDDRLTSDEFFRPSYTEGFWIKGEILSNLKYMAMAATSMSILGVSASQLDQGLNTQSFSLAWLPTTGEFGLYGTFGDFDYHELLATRVGGHFTHSREDKQTQPGTDGIENTQIRLTDGNVIFTPDLFGPGIRVNRVTYDMTSLDAGVKYKGFSLEAEYYWRQLSNFTGTDTGGIADIHDHGYQVQSSAMVIPKTLQVYLSGGEIRGPYGNGSEIRAGANFYIVKERGLRMNGEWIHLKHCPVGYNAVPYPVGGNGDVFHMNFEMNF